ncbi:O-antigen ligase [Isoptericola jiangsuensis]|uniref:O-antigen ligase n=1 Tax=Isoptericola jiangsuensis TaxID=548579 RepID=A0A2A9F0B3_9MICO|nr:O-antigen ligase family protein [Isoptericola jiangsuensis]PFG44226.1 O-antigen ligase [Isoptericola jiangsuensis]
MTTTVPRLIGAALALAATALLLVALGGAVPTFGGYALIGGLVVLVVGATLVEPMAFPLLVTPALLSVEQVGGVLSVSDFLLFPAFWVVLLLGRRPFSPTLRAALWLNAFYQFATLFTVVANPYAANLTEWFHAWLLVGGALVVGWGLGAGGLDRPALALLLAPMALIGVLAAVAALPMLASGQWSPVYLDWPVPLHKNFIGSLLAYGAAIAYARPPWIGWPRWVWNVIFVLTTLGVLASQARQAWIALSFGILVILLRRRVSGAHRSLWILLPVALAIYVVTQLLNDQLDEGGVHNSAGERMLWYRLSFEVWRQSSIWFGAGLRWWYTDKFPLYQFQPPNAELEVLSSAGVVGLFGFLVMSIGIPVLLWRKLPPEYGTIAAVVPAMRLVNSQFDLYWVAVSVSIPYLVAGICLGAAAAKERGWNVRASPPTLRLDHEVAR